jgi:hypothetical protein
MYSFDLHLISFFNAHDSQVWSFDGVAEFLHIPFTVLELIKISSVFFFNFYFTLELWDSVFHLF